MTIQTIFFDLDGTLTDSAPGIVDSYRYTAQQMKVDVPDDAVLRSFVGPPLRGNLVRMGVSEDKIEEAVEHYMFWMIEKKASIIHNKVYDGIVEMLEALGDKYTLAVATSKREDISIEILKHFNLSPYFSGVYGANTLGKDGEKDKVIARALVGQGVTADQVVMVGDRAHDMMGAKRNGTASIGVLWGYGAHEELTEAGAETLVETPFELTAILTEKGR